MLTSAQLAQQLVPRPPALRLVFKLIFHISANAFAVQRLDAHMSGLLEAMFEASEMIVRAVPTC
jgi:hypothetical protein